MFALAEQARFGALYPLVMADEFVPGDEVVLFGPGRDGELTADEWAARIDTIGRMLGGWMKGAEARR